jgi:PAS domain-containing protein
MQKELTSNLKMTIAKLELKQLEFINKLSLRNDDYIIRCITCPETSELLALNGDWERVTNHSENECIGKTIYEFMPDYELRRAKVQSNKLKNKKEFDSFVCDILDKDGCAISVDWKSKYFPNINATVSIGRVKK